MANGDKITGMSAWGEQDRSPEFKEARGKLVDSVNNWLIGLAEKRDAGESLADGTTITDKPRIVRTILGRMATGVDAMAEESKYGVSLIGDGQLTQLKLQAVRPDTQEGGISSIEVTGSDPVARQVMNGEYNLSGQHETVASFSLSETNDADEKQYFAYEVRGNGSVYRKYVTPAGMNTSQNVLGVADLEMAAMAFEQVKSQIDA